MKHQTTHFLSKRSRMGASLIILAMTSALGAGAVAQTESNTDASAVLQRIEEQETVLRIQAEELQKQGAAIENQFRILRAQFEELQVLKRQLTAGHTEPNGVDSGVRLSQDDVDPAKVLAPGMPRPVAPKGVEGFPDAAETQEPVKIAEATTADTEAAAGESGDAARPNSERPMDQLLIDAGGILLPRGTLQIEPSFEYTHSSGNNVAISGFTVFDAIVIGQIRVDDLRRDIMTASLAARYGLADRLQIEARVPGIMRRDTEIFGIGTADIRERTTNALNLGDLETTLSWQPLANNGLIPATVLRGTARFPTGTHPFEIPTEDIDRGGQTRLVSPPTGTGFYSATAGGSFVWRNDPLVYFGGADYTLALPRTFDDFGRVNPGNTFGWNAGFNFAVSDRVSISTSFINRHTKKTFTNGMDQIGTATNDARLIFGTAIATPSGRTLLASAGIGLTEQSPDFSITFSLPFTYRGVGDGIPFLPSADPAGLF